MSNRYATILALGSSLDPLAQDFLTATGITDPTITTAINELCLDFRAYNLIPKIPVFYPFVGSTNNTCKYNMMDARDLDAAFRLNFIGDWNFSASGIQGNGSNTYARTYFVPSSHLAQDDASLSIYIRNFNALDKCEVGCQSGSNKFYMAARWSSGGGYAMIRFDHLLASGENGLYVESSIPAEQTTFRNGTKIVSIVNAGIPLPNLEVFIGAWNTSGTPTNVSDKQIASVHFGLGFTDTDNANFNAAIAKFQTTLGRAVPPAAVSDTDANNYISSLYTLGYSVNSVQSNAINDLFLNLKGAGSVNSTDNMYADLKIVRPYFGGLASTNGLNAIAPTTSPANFYGTFNGGWVHTNAGSKPNGVNGYMSNNFIPSVNMSSDTNGGIFCNIVENSDVGFDIGCQTFTNFTGLLIASNYGGQRYSRALTNNQFNQAVPVFRDSIGFWGSIQINGQAYFQRNTTLTNYAVGASGRPDRDLVSGALNANGTITYYGDKRRNFEVVMNNVRDTNRPLILKQIVDAFNTAVGR